MTYNFEIYLLGSGLTTDQWDTLYKGFSQYGGMLSRFQIVVKISDNVVRYFVISPKDLSALSSNLDGAILRPVDEDEIDIPTTSVRENFVRFVTGGSLLDLKEKYAVKKGKQLLYMVVKVQTINHQKAYVRMSLYFQSLAKQWSKNTKRLTFFPSHLLAVDFDANTRYLKKTVSKYLNIEKSLHIMGTDPTDALFEINAFPYAAHNYYLKLTNYEFDKHSFIVGASGSGKSKFISLFVDRLQKTALKMNYRVVVIDPHASLQEDFASIPNHTVINFAKDEGTELFAGAAADITAATELTSTLFKSLLADQFNARLDRVLRFSLFVLFTAQSMSLDKLKRFLTDIELRNQIIGHVSGFVPPNIVQFFGADFNEMRTKYYNEAILPIVSMVDEMQLQPALVNDTDVSLAKTINDNFLTVFSLNKVSMGEKVVKTIAGLLIQQIFLLAQARVFSQKVILIIDEVSVVQNPALAQVLAEARKFNLTVILTQQYLGQIEKDLKSAIFSNAYNFYAFKVSQEDARELEGNLNIELPKEIVEEEHAKGVDEAEIRVKIMTELHPRECLVRVLANGQVAPCIKARTMDAPTGSTAVNEKAEDLKTYKQVKVDLPTKFVERPAESAPAAPIQSEPAVMAAATPKATSGQPATGKQWGFSLSELLAQHSSSRLKVNKRKDDN